MSKQQLSKFITDKTEYIKNLESMLHFMCPAKPVDHGDLNKTFFGDDVLMANVKNDWRTFDDVHGTMKELNRQRCILLRAELVHEKTCPHDERPHDERSHDERPRERPHDLPVYEEAQDDKHKKKN
jgi:hypothetical protein